MGGGGEVIFAAGVGRGSWPSANGQRDGLYMCANAGATGLSNAREMGVCWSSSERREFACCLPKGDRNAAPTPRNCENLHIFVWLREHVWCGVLCWRCVYI